MRELDGWAKGLISDSRARPLPLTQIQSLKLWRGYFIDGSAAKESTCNAGDMGLIPGLGRSLGGGNDNPFQYSSLKKSHGRGCKEPGTTEGLNRQKEICDFCRDPCYKELEYFLWERQGLWLSFWWRRDILPVQWWVAASSWRCPGWEEHLPRVRAQWRSVFNCGLSSNEVCPPIKVVLSKLCGIGKPKVLLS